MPYCPVCESTIVDKDGYLVHGHGCVFAKKAESADSLPTSDYEYRVIRCDAADLEKSINEVVAKNFKPVSAPITVPIMENSNINVFERVLVGYEVVMVFRRKIEESCHES